MAVAQDEVKKGMEEKAREFRDKGGAIYLRQP
jgi:hypothetical protein